MNARELVRRLRVGALGSFTAVGWTPDQVAETWERDVPEARRARRSLSVWPEGGHATKVTIAAVERRHPRTGVALMLAGATMAAVCAVCLALLPREATPPPEPGEQCWEWDRPNHTLVVKVSPEFFEMAHDAYRLTGKEPDRLTECTK
jgi:hypothetical protein